ncbi:HD-GYP domain-containing protein [Bacillus alkalicellulosilyticus]|uniref:HD-GYP domain-containing protein n=1 Tax=Alkalihalobacterium alkalicellulosilyticum TaxID=1912214 RepID=UPI0009963692|nr:HD domain-containing phosphohydrolase [Bacillus alkalicellulosilyticus]
MNYTNDKTIQPTTTPISFKPLEELWNHDLYTFQHSLRVAELLHKFAKYLSYSDTTIHLLYELGAKHDVGKIIIPTSILNKTDALQHFEKQKIFMHTIFGREILKHYHTDEVFLDSVLYHHENEDGSGYPHGISGSNIPMYAKMLRVVDSYDAMTNNRSYQNAFPPEVALEELRSLSGKWYDPEVVDNFIKMMKLLEESKEESKTILRY